MDFTEKEFKLKEFLKEYDFEYKSLDDSELMQVYNLYFNKIIEKKIISATVLLYYGVFYKIKKNYDDMKKYYLMAIDKGNDDAMNNLGFYYREQKDYENMLKYYSMAIEKGNNYAMFNLGYHYYSQNDFNNMEKCYLLAIEKNNENAMIKLAKFYREQKNYNKMMKYYLMAMNIGNKKAGIKVRNLNDEIKEECLLKYYLENEEMKKKIKKLEECIIELEFKPGGPGYNKTKEHFETLINFGI